MTIIRQHNGLTVFFFAPGDRQEDQNKYGQCMQCNLLSHIYRLM